MADVNPSQNMVPANPGADSTFMPGLANLGLFKQAGLMIGLAASIALGIVIALWAQKPDMRPMGHYDSQTTSDAVSYLEQNKIPYQLASDGSLLVAQDRYQQAKLALASQGINETSADGFLQKDSGFGVSQRLEQARLTRNQEMQLEKSISQFSGVRAVQVHLAIPRQTTFVGSTKKPSASVVLNLINRGRMDREQGRAIVDLVAGAVPGLDNAHVSVTDQFGRLYHSGSMSGSEQASEREFLAESKRQQELSSKIENLLSPILGPENFTVQVNVDMDFTRVSQTQKVFNPDLSAVISEKKFETSSTAANTSGGVAGALSNQPPAASTIPDNTNAAGTNSTNPTEAQPLNKRVESERKFDVDTTISHTQQQVGNITRLTVSVGVNYMDDPQNPGTLIPRPAAVLDKINRLVQGVVGYNIQRGDEIVVDSFQFIKPEALPDAAPLEFYEQPLFQALWKPVVAFIGIILLIFVILKPLMAKLSTPPPVMAAPQNFPAIDNAAMAAGQQAMDIPMPGEISQVSRAKAMVGNDPKQVAALVQNWISEDE